jgi:hypothetical protein
MDEHHLQDRLYWGLNRTANILGRVTDAYRPCGVSDPLDQSNRYLRLRAAFSRADGNFNHPVGYGTSIWRGYFDASYTCVGDYLVQKDDVWFVAAQQSLLPVLCVKTNRIISVTRQLIPVTGTSYGLEIGSSTISVISKWPASLLGVGTDGKSPTHLPGDTAVPTMIALLPSVHQQVIQPTDVVIDDRGTTGTIVAVELSDLGLRLNIRHVST